VAGISTRWPEFFKGAYFVPVHDQGEFEPAMVLAISL